MHSTAGENESANERMNQQMSTGPAAAAATVAPTGGPATATMAGEGKLHVDGDSDSFLVPKSDVRPHDILMGRGHHLNPGNDRFLRIVSERQADYRAARFFDKQRIATEVLDLVVDLTHLSGREEDDEAAGGDGPARLPPITPARFLQLESGDRKSDDCVFRVMTGKAVEDKVKMALRQKKPQQDDMGGNEGSEVLGDAPIAAACWSLDQTGATLSSSRGTTISPLALERSLQQLLPFLRAVQGMVGTLREKYDADATSSQLCTDLHSLGKVLYRTLGGTEYSRPIVPTDVNRWAKYNPGERLPKRERRREEMEGRRAEDGVVPLQDLGFPTSISIFVQSLIDAIDEDVLERFELISSVDADLRLMIDYPRKYLFDPPNVVSTGKLEFSSELYGVQIQQGKLMAAFQNVVVTGEERRGLVLISGPSGAGKVRQDGLATLRISAFTS